MSSPYPPQNPPRRLERSRSNKVLGGVCAGVARYLNMDVTLVRVLTVVLTFFTGVPVVAYIVALFVMPEEQQPPYAGPQTGHVPTGASGPADPVWGAGGAPWDQGQSGATPPPPPSPAPSPQPSPEPAPTTAAPERGPESASAPDPEPVAETPTPKAPSGEESTWESAAADPHPQDAESEPRGETPPSSPPASEGHKPTS